MRNSKHIENIEIFVRYAKLEYGSVEDSAKYILQYIKNSNYFHYRSFNSGVSVGLLIMFICKYFKLF